MIAIAMQHDPGDGAAPEGAECGALFHVVKGTAGPQPRLKGVRPAAPEEEGGTAGRSSVLDLWESVVGVLEMREALVAPHLARLEPQPGEPVAAHHLVAAAAARLGGDEHEAARGAGPRRRRRRRRRRSEKAAEVMDSMMRCAGAASGMDRCPRNNDAGVRQAGAIGRGRARAAWSSAGRMPRATPAADAPARAAEGQVGHGGEALLVLAQRQQQMRGAVGRRQRRRRRRARTSSARGGRPGGRAARPPPPRATRRARRARARGPCARAARAPRGRRGRRAGRAPSARPRSPARLRGLSTLAPRLA